MPNESEADPMEEELTLKTISEEFGIKRGTLNNWVSDGTLTGRKATGDFGIKYWLIKRKEVNRVLQKRSNIGRPLKRS